MTKVEIRNEMFFKAPTRVGLLADVTEALRDAGVNLLAIGAYDKGDFGEFLMITDNNKAAGEALAGMGGEIDMASVIVLELANEPGALAAVARRLADHGVNIAQIHATTSDSATAMIVLRVTHEIDAVKLLEDV
jgi:hypothetical protein